MELAAVEKEKARAHEAFVRGQLQEALKIYDSVEATYVRFGFVDGLVALRYNRLLAALEADERTVVPRAALTLAEALGAVSPPGSATVAQVAEGVLKLLPTVIRGLDPEIEERLALSARPFAQPRPALSAEAFPSAGFAELPSGVLCRLHADDAARIALTHPSLALTQAMLPTEAPPGAIDEALASLEGARVAWEAGDRGAAYQALVAAFERARTSQPGLAAELQTGLRRLEEEGLPERLDYMPGLPVERRLRTSLELHGRLARGLSGEASYESAARRQWSHVIECAQKVQDKLHVRRVRGGGNAEDAEIEANAAIWRSLAHRHLGEIGAATSALTPYLSRAQRCAYGNVSVSVRILLQAADLAEREGDVQRAASLYGDAAELAAPGVSRSGRTLELANVIGEAIAENAAERIPSAAVALAGVARVSGSDDARARQAVTQALDLLTLSRVYLPLPATQAAQIWVELASARLGDALAAGRAFELACVLNEPLAAACALLHRATLGASATTEGRAGAPLLFSQAASEASRGAAGEVRRAAELAAALAWHEAGGTANDGARLEVHLRRFAEAGRPQDFPDGAGDYDICLPAGRRAALEPLHERLLTEGRTGLLYQLSLAERRRTHEERTASEDRVTADAVAQWHRADFEARRRKGHAGLDAPRTLIAQLAAAARDAGSMGTSLAADEAVLSFRVAPGGTLAFVQRAGQAAPQAFRIPVGAADLQGNVTELLRVLRAGDEHRRDLHLRAQELFQTLIRPALGALGDVTSLQIVPDGPLWALPFPVLLGENFLCERFELSIARYTARVPEASTHADEAVVIVAGDHATSRDLRLSVLERDGLYRSIVVRTGEDLSTEALPEALRPARLVHLLGTLGTGPTIDLCDDAPATPVEAVADALRGAVGVMLFGPVEGPTGRNAVGSLLTGVTGGVFARHWPVDEDGEFLHELFRASATACTARELAAALAATRRAAIRARLPARLWSAYELYTHERD